MRSFEEVKQDVLEQIEHIRKVKCDSTTEICSLRRRQYPNSRVRFGGGSCPGAKSVCDQLGNASSVQELKEHLGNLMCVQTMFGHLLEED